MQKTTIFKIESAARRITVDELVGFATVFGFDVTDMLTPVEIFQDHASGEAVKTLVNHLDEMRYQSCTLVSAIVARNDEFKSLDGGSIHTALQRSRKDPLSLQSNYVVELPADCVAPSRKFVSALWKSADNTSRELG